MEKTRKELRSDIEVLKSNLTKAYETNAKLEAELARRDIYITTVTEDDEWPESISDGMELPCAVCGFPTKYDYNVDGEFWRLVVPKEIQPVVVCLTCLDKLAQNMGLSIAEHIERIQYTGIGKTIVLHVSHVYYYGDDEPS